ncbi:MAG: cupin domain-containing protein [Sphingobacteriaceae bacterium]|nr:cupin domain-containing protein [Sphingobacteriaceae bacterium]
MKSREDYINSGILELYVLGETSPEESREIAELAAADPFIKKEITEIELALEKYATEHSVEPDPIIRPFLLATIDYMDRLKGGEQPAVVPELNKDSKISDFSPWLSGDDMSITEDFDGVYAKILSSSTKLTCAIVWIKEMAPQEVHDDEFEKFLIVEGSCTITIEENHHKLVAGDYLAIPLHKKHHVTVTSAIPCKVILQRVAA